MRNDEICSSLLQSLMLSVVRIVNLQVKSVAFIPLKFDNSSESEFMLEIYKEQMERPSRTWNLPLLPS